ncbi:hypothetical protein M405DRAFT_814866 [Rhizopogon salebrosus TDB-379]|nr:hypothetical protein M405DRAFT_814866 [Rhizopogon salebrosus TDB-379]
MAAAVHDYAAKAPCMVTIWPVAIMFLRVVDKRRWGRGGNGNPWNDPILCYMVPTPG